MYLTQIPSCWQDAQPGEPTDSLSNSLIMQTACRNQPKDKIAPALHCPAVVSLDQHPHVLCMDTSDISLGVQSTESSHSAPRAWTSIFQSGVPGRAVQ